MTMTQKKIVVYMIRKSFRVPKLEHTRFYGRQHDLKPSDMRFKSDYDDDTVET